MNSSTDLRLFWNRRTVLVWTLLFVAGAAQACVARSNTNCALGDAACQPFEFLVLQELRDESPEYVAAGYYNQQCALFRSNGLTEWEVRASIGGCQIMTDVVRVGDLYVAGGQGSSSNCFLLVSEDHGLSWTSLTCPAGSGSIYDIEYINGEFVAMGSANTGSSTATVLTSPDGYNWTHHATFPANTTVNDFEYNAGFYIVAALTGIYRSADIKSSFTGPLDANSYLDVEVNASGVLMAVTDGGTPGIVSTDNGASWSQASTTLLSNASSANTVSTRAVSIGDTFVVGGGGFPNGSECMLDSSTDAGASWSGGYIPHAGCVASGTNGNLFYEMDRVGDFYFLRHYSVEGGSLLVQTFLGQAVNPVDGWVFYDLPDELLPVALAVRD